MEGSSIDFIELLNGDLSSKIISILDDPADVVCVASVSRTWREFVTASGFFKSLRLRLFPALSSTIKAIEENNAIEPLGFNTTGSVEVDKLKKNHGVYAFLAAGLVPPTYCIVKAISASSTDHYLEENIHNTLEPREVVNGMLSYWSSLGESSSEVPETLTYKLVSKLCFITDINIKPYQDITDYNFPIFSASAVRFRMGHVREPQQGKDLLGDYEGGRRSIEDHVVWTYTSEKFPMVQEHRLQNFKLPEPVLAIGGLLQIELLGRVALASDDLYYFCVSNVQVVGHPLTNDFVADLIDNSGKCVLKCNEKTAVCNNSNSRFEPLSGEQVYP
ncbi:F-box protein At4g00755-like [Papaver somniferum]|uniref:F-box protein At4g00755-like n=1 Tax=Papaver somniferum TaxID=3469 RepID=UPI000E6FE7D5|nr:F-box protein At4g00755-like [Papaver somniferum]XP_026409263.1 F-box protein At4g00755-like [Papaver somniferum]XP_026409264.1 F-box protein At4g00755-like [Papaver somniferum]